ncbi:hypothetical protein SmJEL517_g01169 [Synchytrium microbalum]|uniref:Aquaporin n=1 Tax=Synchytrium microbalum TaxID=1806994 RepID=A0A507C6Q8_9FUNG|nr:uncharacterized protein SmJEL517_g01169 [Synchytrium microbalum]TPX36727.1 hypothetical protein SmJEL517_g01169 [Synchytrium microbalum]
MPPSLRHDILATADEFFATTIFLFGAYGTIRAGLTGANGALTNDSLIVIAFGFGCGFFDDFCMDSLEYIWSMVQSRNMHGGIPVWQNLVCPFFTITTIYTSNPSYSHPISLLRCISYTIAECLAAIFAAALIKALLPGDYIGATAPGLGSSLAQTWFLEMIMTCVLALVVLNAGIDGQTEQLAPLHIGLTLLVIHLGAVPFSGSGVNPARSLGSAVLSGVWTAHWIYWTAPIVGGLLGFAIWKLLQKGRAQPDNDFLAAVSEFIGTAMFLFLAYAGIQAAIQTSAGTFASTLLVVALSFGFSLMITIWTFAGVTGSPQNPAVCLAVYIIGEMSLKRMIFYIIAELLGALFAGGLTYAIFPNKVTGATTLGASTTQVQGAMLEAISTAILLFVILRNAVTGTSGIFGVSNTRGFRPDRPSSCNGAIYWHIREYCTFAWVYVVGQAIGVVIAVGVWKVASLTDEEVAADAAVEEEEEAAKAASPSPTGTLIGDELTDVKTEQV